MKEFFFSLRSYKGVSRKSNGRFKYQGCFMKVSWIGSFKVVSRRRRIHPKLVNFIKNSLKLKLIFMVWYQDLGTGLVPFFSHFFT